MATFSASMANAVCADVQRFSVGRALDIQRSDAACCAWARPLERVARLVWVDDQAGDEWNVIDVINSNGPIPEARSVVLHEEGERACATQRLHDLVPSSGKLGWVARIHDDVASFCFDGNDAQLCVTLHSGFGGAGAHDAEVHVGGTATTAKSVRLAHAASTRADASRAALSATQFRKLRPRQLPLGR